VTISFNVAAIAAVIPAMSLDLGLADLLVAKIIPFYMIPYGIGALIYAPLTRYVSYKVILGCSMALYSSACF
jgi:MFS family permease